MHRNGCPNDPTALAGAAAIVIFSDGGVPSKAPTFDQLEANQDEPQPADFDRAHWQRLVGRWRQE